MNFEPQETVPIYWFLTIFNQVTIKLNEAIFFFKLEWLKFTALEMRRDWRQMRPAIVFGIGQLRTPIQILANLFSLSLVTEVWKIWTQESFHK